MKALEILKDTLEELEFESYQENNEAEIEYINEVIKELEELKNRSCDNCKHFNTSLLLSNPPKKYCEKLNISFDIGGCGDYWESINEK